MPTIELLTGPAGTGKSHEARDRIKQRIDTGTVRPDEVLHLCYARALRVEALRERFAFLPAGRVENVHSLAYRVLKYWGRLPQEFGDYPNLDKAGEELRATAFDKLIHAAVKLTAAEVRAVLGRVQLVYVDEYQELREDLVGFLRFLSEVYPQAAVMISGDPLQVLSRYQNEKNALKVRENFERVGVDFPGREIRETVLHRNWRTPNGGILRAVNGFLRKRFTDGEKYTYAVDDSKGGSEEVRRPVVRWFTHQAGEADFVLREIERVGAGRHVAVLARYRRDLWTVQERLENEAGRRAVEKAGGVVTSTIHQQHGLEADVVFVVGFDPLSEADVDRDALYYTAFTRARERLVITSAHPKRGLGDVFEAGTVQVVDEQGAVFQPYRKLKTVRSRANFTVGKLQAGMLDSVTYRLRGERAPWRKYVPHNAPGAGSRSFMKRWIDPGSEVGMTVAYHNAHRMYYFEFYDLAALKKSGYGDWDIHRYCMNRIGEYFDGRVQEKDIEVTRADVALWIQAEDEAERERFLRWAERYFTSSRGPRSVLSSEGGAGARDYRELGMEFTRWEEETLYVNHHARNQERGLTTAVYLPEGKTNHNRVHIPNMVKVEARLRGGYIGTQGVIGTQGARAFGQIVRDKAALKALMIRVYAAEIGESATWRAIVERFDREKVGGILRGDFDGVEENGWGGNGGGEDKILQGKGLAV